MEYLINFITVHIVEIVIAAILLAVLSFVLMVFNMIRTGKVIRKYKRLMRGVSSKSLESMLIQQLDALDAGLAEINELKKTHTSFNKQLRQCIQRIGVVRYNAFDHMGSDQSFSIALLNEAGNGFVLTSLYGRNTSSSFAKPLKSGRSVYPLSDEEKDAIEQALA